VTLASNSFNSYWGMANVKAWPDLAQLPNPANLLFRNCDLRPQLERIDLVQPSEVAEFADVDAASALLDPSDPSLRTTHQLGDFKLAQPSASSRLDQKSDESFMRWFVSAVAGHSPSPYSQDGFGKKRRVGNRIFLEIKSKSETEFCHSALQMSHVIF
jgi:hypothetical protein